MQTAFSAAPGCAEHGVLPRRVRIAEESLYLVMSCCRLSHNTKFHKEQCVRMQAPALGGFTPAQGVLSVAWCKLAANALHLNLFKGTLALVLVGARHT